MNSNRPIKVLITSIDAGGGHKELKLNLIRTLSTDPNIEVFDYHSDAKFIENIYKVLARKVPLVWELLYKLGKRRRVYKVVKPFLRLPEKENLLGVLNQHNPDVVLCTHFNHGIIFANLKKKARSKFVLVSCIPDYGEQLPQLHLTSPADYYLVRDEATKKIVSKYIPEERIFTYGTTVNPHFNSTRMMDAETLKEEFLEFINEYVDTPHYDPALPNILFIGGSGWTTKSLKLIKAAAATGKYNVFVSCGKDTKLYETIFDTAHINAFRFVSQDVLSIIERYVDLTVLSSIAPATMHELMSVGKYPLFVHRYIKGQESEHIELLKKWNIGLYEHDDTKMLSLIETYLEHPERFSSMITNALEIRQKEETKADHNAKIIESIVKLSQ